MVAADDALGATERAPLLSRPNSSSTSSGSSDRRHRQSHSELHGHFETRRLTRPPRVQSVAVPTATNTQDPDVGMATAVGPHPRQGVRRVVMIFIALVLGLVVLASATDDPAAPKRNNATEIIRGGAWIYHEGGVGPCGNETLRDGCVFAEELPMLRLAADNEETATALGGVELTISRDVVGPDDSVKVSVQYRGQSPTPKDWIGRYCVTDEAAPPADRQYVDWVYSTAIVDGSVSFGPTTDKQCAWAFRYFTEVNGDAYVRLAVSALVRQAGLTLGVSREVIEHLAPLTVSVKLTGFQPTAKDWIGMYCIDDELQPLGDRQYLDWVYVNTLVNGAIQVGPLANMRCSWQFRYFTQQGSDAYVRKAVSKFVRMAKGKQEPLHVRAAATTKTFEMRIMWVSAAVDAPTVEYGATPNSLTRSVRGSGTTYAASDMCHAPANQVAANMFRDPGVIYTAVLKALMPNSVYYYRVSGGPNTPQSKIFKLKTPPAPGVQKELASFFVYGDLGDWNIHATGQMPAKRSSTTIQLMRRDMDDPKTNYVAVMHDGDLSYAMGKTYLWDQFGALIEPVSTEIPYMIGIGNHEYCHTSGGDKDPSGAPGNGFHPPEGNYGADSLGECGVPTNKRFIMPDNGNKVFWWSVEMGLVHHTMISSEHDYTPGSPMHEWLVKDLASVDRTKTPWLFLHLHRPIYTSEKYESDYKVSLLLRKNLEAVLGKYKVDAVFSGHYHAYELTCPVFAEECRSEKLPGGLEKAKAPVHIMVGSAGADVDNVGYYDVPWRVAAQLEYGYGRVHVHNATHAQFEFVRNRDEIVASSTWIISDHDWVV